MLDAGDLETTVALGPELRFTKDISPLLEWMPLFNEVWIGGSARLLFGDGFTDEWFLHITGEFEGVRYLGGGLSWVNQLAFGYGLATQTLHTTFGDNIGLSGGVVALEVGTGLELAFSPYWNARALLSFRTGLGSAELTNKSKAPGVVRDAGTLMGVQAAVVVAYTY